MILSVKNKNKLLLLTSITIIVTMNAILLVLLTYKAEFNLSSLEWSSIFIVIIFLIIFLKKINNVSFLSIQSLFLFSSLLFIGGRFFASLLSFSDVDLFSLNYFTHYTLNDSESTRLFILIIIGITMPELGQYIAIYSTPIKRKIKSYSKINIPPPFISLLLIITTISLCYILILKINLVMQYGYVGLYMNQIASTYASSLESLLNTFLWIVIAISFAYGDKKQKYYGYFLFFTYSALLLFMGARGLIGVFVLFSLWLYGNYGSKNISILKIILSLVLFIFIINELLISTGMRESVAINEAFLDSVKRFLYNQGITLMVFDASMKEESYPFIAYVQTFIPGASYIYSFFSPISFYETHFSHYLGYSLNKNLFLSGNGLGWSIFADIYLLSARNFNLYAILFAFWGYLLTKLEIISVTRKFINGLFIIVVIQSLFIARGTLNNLFPLLIYYLIFMTILFFFLQFLHLSSTKKI